MAFTVSDILDSEEPVQAVRQMSYGPIQGEYTRATMVGPKDNVLDPLDVAASDDTGLNYGDVIDIGDGTYRRVADSSFVRPGQPTHGTIELRDKPDQGTGMVKKVTVGDVLGHTASSSVSDILGPTGETPEQPKSFGERLDDQYLPDWVKNLDQMAGRGVRRALNLPVSKPPTVEELLQGGKEFAGGVMDAAAGYGLRRFGVQPEQLPIVSDVIRNLSQESSATPQQTSDFLKLNPAPGVSAPEMAGENDWYKKFRDAAGERLAPMTSPQSIAQIASFTQNPVALKSFMAQVAAETPETAKRISDTAQKTGWTSPETAAEIAVSGVNYLPFLHEAPGAARAVINALPKAPEAPYLPAKPEPATAAPEPAPAQPAAPSITQLIEDELKKLDQSKGKPIAPAPRVSPETGQTFYDESAPRSPGLTSETARFQPESKGVPIAQKSSEDYVKQTGIGQIVPPSDAKVDVENAQKIADDYEKLPAVADDEATKKSYAAFAKEVEDQFRHAQEQGVTFEFTKSDPYRSSAEMMQDLKQNGRLRVFTGGEDHPYIGSSTADADGLTINDKFRAVHDLYGHASEGNQFGPIGEERAWRKHSAMFSPEARPAMTTETRGQNSWVNYGKHMFDKNGWRGDKTHPNYIAPADRPFAKQKAALLPEEHSSANGNIIRKVIDQTKSKGGITIDMNGNQPTKGFSFAPSKSTETKIPLDQFNVAAVDKYILDHDAELRQPGAHLGAWLDHNGVPTLDVSVVSHDINDALGRAAKGDQEAIYDIRGGKEIPVARGSGRPVREEASAGGPVQAGAAGNEAGVRAEGDGVALNRDATDFGRAVRNLPEAKKVIEREFGESAKIADKKEAQYPGYGARMVDKLSKGAAAADDVEHAAVLNELAKSQDAFDEAVKYQNDNPGDKGAKQALDTARDHLQKTYTAAENAGTGTARGLSFRRALKARNWSKANLEANMRAVVNKGAPLTPEQIAKVDAIDKRIQSADKIVTDATGGIESHLRYSAGLDPKEAEKMLRDAGMYGLIHKDNLDTIKRAPDLQSVIDIFKELNKEQGKDWAKKGEFLKGWYQKMGDFIEKNFPDGNDSSRFGRVFGTFGANTPPLENTIRALQLWNEWEEAGRPTDPKAIDKILEDVVITGAGKEAGKSAKDIMAWGNNIRRTLTADDPTKVQLSGPKVHPYAMNVLRDLDRATLDRHMGIPYAMQRGMNLEQAMDKGSTIFGKRVRPDTSGIAKEVQISGFPGVAYDAHLRDVARALTEEEGSKWDVANVQEAQWGHFQPYKLLAKEMRVPVDKLLDGSVNYYPKRLEYYREQIQPENILGNAKVQSELDRLNARRADEHSRLGNGAAGSQPGTRFFAGADPDEVTKLSRRVKLIERGTKAYNDKVAAGDTSPMRVKPAPVLGDNVYRALYEREKAKADYQTLVAKELFGQKSKPERFLIRAGQLPRRVAVAGHGLVFPVTHAGDLILNPTKWNTFGKGFLNTYISNFSKDFHSKIMGKMQADAMFHLAHASDLDVGMDMTGAGLLKGSGPASRAWDALKVMRYELWKKQMQRYLKKNPGMTEAEKLDLGQNLATWSNHATGSGKGKVSQFGSAYLFGPKLTQSKINRLISDPYQTMKTFAHWSDASIGEKAVAWTRVRGLAKYAITLAGFLYANQAYLKASGSDQEINFTDPSKGDFWAFKIAGTDIAIPGMHSELRYLAKLLAIPFESHETLKGSRQGALWDTITQYVRSKAAPVIGLGLDLATTEDYRGRPLPWSSEEEGVNRYGKPSQYLPRYAYGEYAWTKAPIFSTGPAKYVYDQMRENGMSAKEALQSTQALVIAGLGGMGFHVHEDYRH